jgi:cytochrome bd-type quinol oxidase subunit 2
MEKYRFLLFAAKVLRVVAWVVLVGGVIGSIVVGIFIGSATNGAASGIVGGLAGGLFGFFIAVVGIIFSFLAWVFMLTVRELLYLFMDVEENTRNTAERITITEKSGRD